MDSKPSFEDNYESYKNLLPREVINHIPIYKDLVLKISEVQKKLQNNFYRVTNIAALEEAVKLKQINPARYSIIEEKDSTYHLVRYSDFFVEEFLQIKNLLAKIEKDLKPGLYKDYISALMWSYSNNNFIDPFKKWLQLPNNAYPVEFVLFPDEEEFDYLFNKMQSFDASLRVMCPDFVSTNNDYKKYLFGITKSLPNFSELHSKVSKEIERLIIRVDYSIFSAGVHHNVPYYSQNLPNNKDQAFNWGSKIVVYKTTIDTRTKNTVYAFARDILANFDMNEQELSQTLTNKVFVHEVVEAFMKFEGSEFRLQNMYLKVREFNSEAFGGNSYVLYLLKSSESTREIRNLAYVYVLTALEYFRRNSSPQNRSSHYYQYVANINYYYKNGAIKIAEDGKVLIDAKKIIECISELSKISSHLLMQGTQAEAEKFFNEHSSTDFFERVLGTNIK